MSLSSTFYKAAFTVGCGLVNAFNFVSGATALRKRGLELSHGLDVGRVIVGGGLGAVGGMVVLAALITAPFATAPFAAFIGMTIIASAAAELAMLPSQLATVYTIGKHEVTSRMEEMNERKKMVLQPA